MLWIASLTGRAGLSSPLKARQASQSAGRQAPVKAMIFSGDQRPDFSRRNISCSQPLSGEHSGTPQKADANPRTKR